MGDTPQPVATLSLTRGWNEEKSRCTEAPPRRKKRLARPRGLILKNAKETEKPFRTGETKPLYFCFLCLEYALLAVSVFKVQVSAKRAHLHIAPM